MQPKGTDWRMELAPFDIPVVVIADNPDLLATACAAYDHWKEEARVAEPGIELRLGSGSTSSTDVSCDIHIEGSRLTLNGAGIVGYADARSRLAECSVPQRLIGDHAAL
ncbi:MAG: hypothetical protein ACM3YM_02390, partial [Sphingomonadales bacterium]